MGCALIDGEQIALEAPLEPLESSELADEPRLAETGVLRRYTDLALRVRGAADR